VVGDGSSGKTVCALELCFWCWKNIKKIKSKIFPKVKKITIVYNNAEGAMDFPIEKMYGAQFECEVEWICDKEIESTCRDYARRMRNLKKGEFLLYTSSTHGMPSIHLLPQNVSMIPSKTIRSKRVATIQRNKNLQVSFSPRYLAQWKETRRMQLY
jgi:hypothetical protein